MKILAFKISEEAHKAMEKAYKKQEKLSAEAYAEHRKSRRRRRN